MLQSQGGRSNTVLEVCEKTITISSVKAVTLIFIVKCDFFLPCNYEGQRGKIFLKIMMVTKQGQISLVV